MFESCDWEIDLRTIPGADPGLAVQGRLFGPPDVKALSSGMTGCSYQEGDKTRGHERRCPDQIEVQPRLTEKREAQLSIDHPCEQPCDREIRNCMDTGGEHSREGTGGRR